MNKNKNTNKRQKRNQNNTRNKMMQNEFRFKISQLKRISISCNKRTHKKSVNAIF